MKIKREFTIHDKKLKVGDRIKVKLPNETHWATCYKSQGSAHHFIFDDCLDELRPMNSTNTTEGGYEASELRAYLKELGEQVQKKLKNKMIPDENGDLLFLLNLREVFGCDAEWNDVSGQEEWFKDRRHRIATSKEEEYAHWWLRDVVSGSSFANVNHTGYCYYTSASAAWRGIRPAFVISSDL